MVKVVHGDDGDDGGNGSNSFSCRGSLNDE